MRVLPQVLRQMQKEGIYAMTVHENLAVDYHQQDTDVYCGVACAQMVLNSIGAGLLDQTHLFNDVRNHTSEPLSWYTPPDGLTWAMNDHRPVGFTNPFVLFNLNTEDAISRKLAWTIHHYQVAPIALVLGGNHWIVVRGYEASAAPASSGDTDYTISAFEVNDPWPPVPSFYLPPPPPSHPAPPPHSATDNCGTGGNRGVANEHIAYSTWKSTYMTANVYGTLWYGDYVAVCDPDLPAKKVGNIEAPVRPFSGEKIISVKEAIKCASKGLERFDLPNRKGFSEAFKEAQPTKPVLVQRLDRTDSFYYIVPYGQKEKMVNAAVAVDGRFGDYQQSIALPTGRSPILSGLDKNRVLDKIVGQKIRLECSREFIIREEAFSLYPALVWKPCLESLSPFSPFHMVTVGDERIYIRVVDGLRFTQLHTNIGGI
jgi:hypothetical protein